MRLHTLAAAPALVLLLTARRPAQAQDSLPAFNSLRTPTSPAFVLLGIAPTSVERPNTPSDVAISFLDRTAALTRLPRDVALELSPYWLVRHPTLKWQDDVTRSLWTSLARTATVSVATADLGTAARPVTGFSVGLRAALASGSLSDSSVVQLRRLGNLLTNESQLINALTTAKRRALDQWLTASLDGASREDTVRLTAQKDEALAAYTRRILQTESYRAAVESTEAAFRKLAYVRQGFVLEVAGGVVWNAPGGAADSARVGRWGAWATGGYQSQAWSFVAVNRFLAGVADTASDILDMGVRVIHTERRWAVSAEAVFRSFTQAGGPPNQHRIAGVFDYALHDDLWVTATLGRDFDRTATGSLLAQLGVSFGFAGQRVQTP